MKSEQLLLDIYNKKFLLPVYSGSLAIEGVLKCLKLEASAKVLITNVVCHSILQAIIDANLTPVIAVPKNGLTLSKEEIKNIVKSENIKVFIAVHQYGYVQEIEKIKGLIIIEDISQAWNIKPFNTFVGEYSDYIITSLGGTKPLCNGIGGLILSNINFIDNFDTKERKCRDYNDSVLEYYYPLSINYKKLIKKANKIVKLQRRNARIFKIIMNKYSFIRLIDENGTIPTYHRYPIYINDDEYGNVIKILEKCKISYQKEYKKKLDCINLVKSKNILVVGSNNLDKCILLKTDNRYWNIRRLKKEMRRAYEF